MRLLQIVVLVLAAVPFLYYILAIYAAWDYHRRKRNLDPVVASFTPPVSVLKPVCGLDREAYENFASFCRQDYPCYEVLFAAANADDPIVPVVEKIRRDFPLTPVRLIVGVEHLGENRKLNNLARLAREACHDLLVVSDSDVRVAPDYLRQVAMHFQDSTVGLVTTFFRGAVAGTLGARLEALVAAAETVPNALVAGKVEKKIQFAFGWTMATTKAHLRGIGGFEGMINCHSDDFEIGNRIAARGLRIALLPSPVEVVLPRQTLREYWRHELRWAVGLRNVRFGGYLGLLLTFGLPWTILAMIFSRSLTLAALYLAAYLFFRLTQVWITAAWALDDASMRRNLWLVPLRDVINLLIWVEALFTTTISWRGTSYRVRKGLLCSTNSVL